MGFYLSNLLLGTAHRFSIEFWSGTFPGCGPKPLSYHFCLMARCPIMLKKATFVSKQFMGNWEKLLSEESLVPFFNHGWCLMQNCPTPFPGDVPAHVNGGRMLCSQPRSTEVGYSNSASMTGGSPPSPHKHDWNVWGGIKRILLWRFLQILCGMSSLPS